MTAAVVLSYDPRFCPVCRGVGQVAVRLLSGRLGLVRALPCPAHVDGGPLTELVERVCPPTPPERGAA